MDMNENNKFALERNHGDHLSNHSSGISADWQFSAPAVNVVQANTSIAAGLVLTPLTSSPYPSAPMMEPFAPGLWNHHANSPTMGLGESNITSTTSATNCIPIGKSVAMSSRGMLLLAVPGISPPSLPHFPADLPFIERAARLSCFSGGNFSGMDLFGPSQPMAPSTNALKDGMGVQLQKTQVNTTADNVVLLPVDHASINRSPIKNQRDCEPCESNFTEGGQEGNTDSTDAAGNTAPGDIGANKRRRTIQDVEKEQVQRGPQSSSETTKENTEAKRKVEQNSSKHSGDNGKDNSEAAKEDYVHVRARRGQATNSHSLAERVRREKISERMKYLQELVPGCSKVTGKAVMLDEIINYVQSLQRQVEFLSMKLATVNPQLDFSIEGLLAKNLLHSHGGSPSATGFSRETIYPQVYPCSFQQGLAHAPFSAMVNPSDAFRRAMNTKLPTTSAYKESSLQTHNPWNGELVMQMTYGANPPPNAQEMNTKPDGFTI